VSDWADEEAARLSNLDRDTREESQWVCDQIASALRSAFQRGKVEGMREAQAMCAAYKERWRTAAGFENEYVAAANIHDKIASRATALEQENKD
jgi:hypothetical protein